MNRRALLTAGVLLFAGCTDRTVGDQTDEKTDTTVETTADTTVTPQSKEDQTTDVTGNILIRVDNETLSEETLSLAVRTGGRNHFEEAVSVDAGEKSAVDPRIDEAGSYEFTVETDDGRKKTSEFHIGDFALQMGSNVIIKVHEENLRILIEQ